MNVRVVVIVLLIALSALSPVVMMSPHAAGAGSRIFTFTAGSYSNLNPLFNSAYAAFDTVWDDGLTQLDTTGLPQPDLATSWTVSSTGTTITFNLRHGVTWQDGSPFTSQDVVYTYQSIINNATGSWLTAFFSDLQNVTAPDTYTAVFHLKAPSTVPMTKSWIPLIPQHIAGDNQVNSTYNANPIGTGPFELSSNNPGSQIVFKANPNYWGGAPYADELIGQIFTSGSTALSALESGSLSCICGNGIAGGLTASVIQQARADPNLVVVSIPSTTIQYLWMPNNPSPKPSPMNNVLVRQAITYALNRSQIVNLLLNGTATPSTSIFPQAFAWANAPNTPTYNTDLAKAGQLLDQAGYPMQANGTRFSTAIYATAGFRVQLSQLLQAQLAKVGIQTTVQTFPDFTSYTNQIEVMKDYSGIYTELHGLDNPNDLAQFFNPALISTGGDNGIMYNNATVGNWIAQADSTTNQTLEAQLWQKVSLAIAQSDAFWPIYAPLSFEIYPKGTHGLVISDFGGYDLQSYRSIYLDSWGVTTTSSATSSSSASTSSASSTTSSTSQTSTTPTSSASSTTSSTALSPAVLYTTVTVILVLAIVTAAGLFRRSSSMRR